jgi:uncharacterized protein (TIGR03083 family)
MNNQYTHDESQPLPRDKRELLERLERARAALDRTVGRLSDAQLVEPGPYDGWSVKDHLVHLSTWEQGIVALLQRRPRYAAMHVDEETYLSGADAVNEIVYAQNKDRPLSDVLASFRQTQRDLLGVLAGLTDADLRQTYSHYQPDEPGDDSGEPVLKWIAGNTYEHYAEHHSWIEALVG